MKKVLLFAAVLFASAMSAEVITMDLTTAKNLKGEAITYETKDIPVYAGNLKEVMDSTYSDGANYRQLKTNDGAFALDHLPTRASYGGSSWEGFTISKVASDTVNQFGCLAKGGVDGVGTPFVIGYFSEYAAWYLLDYSPCHVAFDKEYYPTEVMICQNALTKRDITIGGGQATAFTEGDVLELQIFAIDDEGYNDEDKDPVRFKLAEGTTYNNGWVKIDLTPLGKTAGLNFEMTTTDKATSGWANTSLYFAMDKLAISTEKPAATAITNTNAELKAVKVLRNGQVVIVRDGKMYNVLGTTL